MILLPISLSFFAVASADFLNDASQASSRAFHIFIAIVFLYRFIPAGFHTVLDEFQERLTIFLLHQEVRHGKSLREERHDILGIVLHDKELSHRHCSMLIEKFFHEMMMVNLFIFIFAQ